MVLEVLVRPGVRQEGMLPRRQGGLYATSAQQMLRGDAKPRHEHVATTLQRHGSFFHLIWKIGGVFSICDGKKLLTFDSGMTIPKRGPSCSTAERSGSCPTASSSFPSRTSSAPSSRAVRRWTHSSFAALRSRVERLGLIGYFGHKNVGQDSVSGLRQGNALR